jgi:hypothetical protein
MNIKLVGANSPDEKGNDLGLSGILDKCKAG